MLKRSGVIVDIALRTHDYPLLRQAYRDTEALPNTETMGTLMIQGYFVDENLFTGSNPLQICFHGGIPHVMKMCMGDEYRRALAWQSACSSDQQSRFIIPFKLVTERGKMFCFMPLHATTLEHLPLLAEITTLRRFWEHLKSALQCFHSKGFAHMDVKPANILITSEGDFILADLGSVVPFGQRSSSTRAYLPFERWVDGRSPLAGPVVDWWMVAMTIYEKACGADIGGGSSEPSQDAVIAQLKGGCGISTIVPTDILEELLAYLARPC